MKKNENGRKSEEKRKKWENPSDPIYTNPIKNLPISCKKGHASGSLQRKSSGGIIFVILRKIITKENVPRIVLQLFRPGW